MILVTWIDNMLIKGSATKAVTTLTLENPHKVHNAAYTVHEIGTKNLLGPCKHYDMV